MNTFDAILSRRSIRKYLDKEVSDNEIEKLLIAAMAAPSAVNKQPWEFYVIKNNEILDKIKQISRNYNFNSKVAIIVCANTKRSLTGLPEDFFNQDCSAAIENILLEAVELGLGTCWCGIYPVVERVNAFKEILNMEDNIIPIALIHVGYPDESKEPRSQFDKDKIHIIK